MFDHDTDVIMTEGLAALIMTGNFDHGHNFFTYVKTNAIDASVEIYTTVNRDPYHNYLQLFRCRDYTEVYT